MHDEGTLRFRHEIKGWHQDLSRFMTAGFAFALVGVLIWTADVASSSIPLLGLLVFLAVPFCGFLLAVSFHSLHNTQRGYRQVDLQADGIQISMENYSTNDKDSKFFSNEQITSLNIGRHSRLRAGKNNGRLILPVLTIELETDDGPHYESIVMENGIGELERTLDHFSAEIPLFITKYGVPPQSEAYKILKEQTTFEPVENVRPLDLPYKFGVWYWKILPLWSSNDKVKAYLKEQKKAKGKQKLS